MTVGIIGTKGRLKALNPSITVVEEEVLTSEEKFQGGTGINLTPPPPSVMKPAIVRRVRERAEELARKIGIEDYSRIDLFLPTQIPASS